MMKIIFFTLFVALFFSACSIHQSYPQSLDESKFSVMSADKKELHFDELLERLENYDIIMLGEKHDEYNHHLAQYFIIKNLSQKVKINVVFEMLSTDKQTAIDKAKAQKELIKPRKLPKAVLWEKDWKWGDYQNLLEFAFYEDNNLSAGNISKAEIKTIYEGAQPLKGFVSTQKNVQDEIKKIIAKSHKIDIKDANKSATLDKLVQIQQYKDRRMADVLVKSPQKAILIAGACHADKNIGIPLHIKDFKSPKKMVVVIFDAKDKKECVNADFVLNFKE